MRRELQEEIRCTSPYSSLATCNVLPNILTFDRDDRKWRHLGDFFIFVYSFENREKKLMVVYLALIQFFAHILASIFITYISLNLLAH